jgi:exodeoxyribonuclease VII large subunit
VQTITPAGEGSINKAFLLLKKKLTDEGLFDIERKRELPFPPSSIALVASVESAAYADFTKILSARWPFVTLQVFDTQVQGEAAPEQQVRAIKKANEQAELADVLVVTRGGGSSDDLQAFDDERVVRAISASRIPAIVAIGHEIDESLSELAADVRASTPSNAAELLVPDRVAERAQMLAVRQTLNSKAKGFVDLALSDIKFIKQQLRDAPLRLLDDMKRESQQIKALLSAYNPRTILERGYVLARKSNQLLTSVNQVAVSDALQIELSDGALDVTVTDVRGKLKK